MIKINLLPAKRKPAKRLTPFQQQIVIGAFVLVIAAGVMGFWWWNMQLRINELKGEKAAAEATIARQESMLKEVKSVEDEKKKVDEKIDVIKKLEADQTGPVRLLDEISALLPKGVGLTLLFHKGDQVDIEGTAFTNNELVGFIDKLKASPLFSDVFLVVSEQGKLEGVEVYKYKLQLKYKGVSKEV
jgi:type IV pilus assembly protein PilN